MRATLIEKRIRDSLSVINGLSDRCRDFYIFGTGSLSSRVWQILDHHKFKIRGFFDNNSKNKSTKNCLPVTKPAYYENALIIIASQWQREILFQCFELGYDAKNIIIINADKRLRIEFQSIRTFGIHGFAPYSLDVFRNFLNLATLNNNVSIKLLSKEFPDPTLLNIYLRHDIDNEKDVKNLEYMISILLSMEIRSAIYVRMDRLEYDPIQLRDYLQDLRANGYEIGIHTSCYLYDNYMDVFKEETDAFHHLFGFTPTSFTIHGMGQVRWDVRMAFLSSIKLEMKSLGYSFCDTLDITYNHVIQDCHGGPDFKNRYIMRDFKLLPLSLKNGEIYLILTHPGYWSRN